MGSGWIVPLIIHSKYSSVSDWLKLIPRIFHHSHRPNLEDFPIRRTDDDVNCQIYQKGNREDLETRLNCFGTEYKLKWRSISLVLRVR